MKTKSTHTLTAQAIRKELKQHFPLVKFCVRSDSFSGGDSVRVEWINGPTYDQVNRIVGKYQYGHFDGMFDIYESSKQRKDITQVKYVQVQRTISESIKDQAFQDGKNYFAEWENIKDRYDSFKDRLGYYRSASDDIHRCLSKRDLTNGYNKEMLFS